jgi:hypothetical protein
MSRNKPLGSWLVASIAQYEVLATAIRSLAAKPDLNTMKRDDYKAECIDRFGISGRTYQFCVWPVARELAGLTMHATAGPKKKKNNL